MSAVSERASMRLDSTIRLLEANSFTKVLERGFALVRDESGRAVKQASALADGARVSITFADETRQAVMGTGGASGSVATPQEVKATKSPKKQAKPKDDSQTELF